MKTSHRSIFRNDAVRRYVESQEKSVLPQLVSPDIFIYLWSLLGLLGISSIIAWFTRVPVYASGSAVVVRWKEDIVVAAFFPPQYLSKLRSPQNQNQKLFLRLDAMGNRRVYRSIITVQPEISSPDTIQKQFALPPQKITQPAVVVIAQLQPISSASTYLGSVGHADVEIGSQSAISLLPLIGNFLQRN